MDQTSFSLLVGFIIGGPIAYVTLKATTGAAWWLTLPIGFSTGTLTLGFLVYLLIDRVGHRFDATNEVDDDTHS